MNPDKLKIPANYHGTVLTGTYDTSLKERLCEYIAGFQIFEMADVPVMPYIAAWRTDEKVIWYEFTCRRFQRLLDCPPDKTADAFREAIVDHRHYKFVDNASDFEEKILDKAQLGSSRKKLRHTRKKTGVVDAVYRLKLPDNKTVWLKDRATTESYDTDKLCLSLGCLTDISRIMMDKDSLQEHNVIMDRDRSILVEAERREAIGQLSSQVFHEIRNPIAAIGGLARRIMHKSDSPELQTYTEVITKEATRLEKVLNNLFHFTQPVALTKHPVNPAEVVNNVMSLLKKDLQENQISIHIKLQEDMPDVSLDASLMEEALVHIVKNSIESHPAQGKIEIDARCDERSLFFIIRDYGLGIRPVHVGKVTEPFFTTKVSGSGFGLSLAKKYIELHQGSLQIMGTAQGTKVVVKVPLSQEPVIPAKTP